MEPKGVTFLQKEFMMMLNRNGMLDYAIVPPEGENELLYLAGENQFPPEAIMEREITELCKIFQNPWRQQEGQTVLLASCCHLHMVVIPIHWEGSVVKLLAEFVSLTNVIYDIPPMGAGAATSEILRRCQHLINKDVKSNQREYSTPYCGFYHTHMASFNQVVINADKELSGLYVIKIPASSSSWLYSFSGFLSNFNILFS